VVTSHVLRFHSLAQTRSKRKGEVVFRRCPRLLTPLLFSDFAKTLAQGASKSPLTRFASARDIADLTLVLDLETGALMYAWKEEAAISLGPFLKRLRRKSRAKSSRRDGHVCGLHFRPARERTLLTRANVFDRVSMLLKLMNETLTQLRRQLFSKPIPTSEKS